MLGRVFSILLLSLGFQLVLSAADPIALTGSNGRQVQFAGVKEARPDGLVLLMQEGKPPVQVSWDKFDVVVLEEEQPAIYQAMVDAQSYRKIIPLNLGIYADYISYEQAIGQLAEGLNKEIKVTVPDFDDYAEAYKAIYTGYYSYDDYEETVKKRRKVHQDYQGFIGTFFRDQNVTLDTSRSSWSGNVYSSSPNKKRVSMPPRQIFSYLTGGDSKYRPEALVYLQSYPRLLNKAEAVLADVKKQVPNPLFDLGDPEQAYLESLLDNNLRELRHLKNEKTFPHSATRNFERLLEVLPGGGR